MDNILEKVEVYKKEHPNATQLELSYYENGLKYKDQNDNNTPEYGFYIQRPKGVDETTFFALKKAFMEGYNA